MYFLPVIALAVAAACSDRQPPAGPDDSGLQPGFKGKPGGGDIVVSSVDPPEAEQGVTLDVAVLGRDFPKGTDESCIDPVVEDCTWAEFGIDEVVTPKVKTNSTTWVSSRKLIANITIDAEATPALYDAIVTFRGRRGIGAEKFEVKLPNPQSGLPEYRADLYINPAMDFMDDGDPAYIDGEQRFQAVTASDGDFLVVNFSKQLRKRDRQAWIKLGCMHPADADRDNHTGDIGPSGNPCSAADYELVEVTDIRAWLADYANGEAGQAFFRVPDERFVEVSRCKPLSGQLAPELRFDADPFHAPDPPLTRWLGNGLVVTYENPDPSTIRKRRVHTTPGANLAWCQNGYTGAHEYWHVDVDFFVIEHE
jgi:hypothetical protein